MEVPFPLFQTIRRIALLILLVAVLAPPANAATVFPLKVSADQRHLVDQNNVPFLINGDSPWLLIVGLTREQVTTYLENRKAKGFNTVLVELIEHEFAVDPPKNAYGDAPFTTAGDFATPNEAYFAHADWVLNEAARLDILVLLTPAYLGYGCGSQGWCQEMKANGTTKMFNYGVYLGNRYKNFKNIIWVEGGDVGAADYGAMNVVNALVDGIKSVDAAHLHTAHCDRQNSGIDCYNQTWLEVNTTYSECSRTAEKTKTDYERTKVMPFFYIEGQYEGEGASQTCLRSQAYWSVLGGSFGHVFGNNPIWEFKSGWQTALNSSGSQSMQRFGQLFASRAWHNLVPDYAHNVVVAGYGSIGSDYVGVARTSDGATVIAYLPSNAAVTVDMSKVAGTSAKALWYKPDSGVATVIGSFPTSGTRTFTPPSSDDWVLVLDNAALDLPPPGGGGTGGSKLSSGSGGGACFVTAVFRGSPLEKNLIFLRKFRDRYLQAHSAGNLLARHYYRASPHLAEFVRNREGLRAAARQWLAPLVIFIRLLAEHDSEEAYVTTRALTAKAASSLRTQAVGFAESATVRLP